MIIANDWPVLLKVVVCAPLVIGMALCMLIIAAVVVCDFKDHRRWRVVWSIERLERDCFPEWRGQRPLWRDLYLDPLPPEPMDM
jgi:hypothetical protein